MVLRNVGKPAETHAICGGLSLFDKKILIFAQGSKMTHIVVKKQTMAKKIRLNGCIGRFCHKVAVRRRVRAECKNKKRREYERYHQSAVFVAVVRRVG